MRFLLTLLQSEVLSCVLVLCDWWVTPYSAFGGPDPAGILVLGLLQVSRIWLRRKEDLNKLARSQQPPSSCKLGQAILKCFSQGVFLISMCKRPHLKVPCVLLTTAAGAFREHPFAKNERARKYRQACKSLELSRTSTHNFKSAHHQFQSSLFSSASEIPRPTKPTQAARVTVNALSIFYFRTSQHNPN